MTSSDASVSLSLGGDQSDRAETYYPAQVTEGTIDHIFNVLKAYKHPFVLVGATAHRWMGCAGCVDEGFDLVVRNSQLNLVVADLIETGHWILFDSKAERKIFVSEVYHKIPVVHDVSQQKELLDYCCDADAVLKSVDFEGGFEYLRLWSDDSYRVNVDQGPFVEVPALHAWNSLLIEEEHHPATRRKDNWWYGPYTRSTADARPLIYISDLLPASKGPNNSSPILVPGIPLYLDALVHHRTHYQNSKPSLSSIASWQIRNLTRYLYLELPHQKDAILFQVEAEAENFLQPYFECYKRKPRYYLTSEKKMVRVKEWDPETYPEVPNPSTQEITTTKSCPSGSNSPQPPPKRPTSHRSALVELNPSSPSDSAATPSLPNRAHLPGRPPSRPEARVSPLVMQENLLGKAHLQ